MQELTGKSIQVLMEESERANKVLFFTNIQLIEKLKSPSVASDVESLIWLQVLLQ